MNVLNGQIALLSFQITDLSENLVVKYAIPVYIQFCFKCAPTLSTAAVCLHQ